MRNRNKDRIVSRLSAQEIAILTMAPDGEDYTSDTSEAVVTISSKSVNIHVPRNTDSCEKSELICSKESIVIACFLAEIFEDQRGDVDRRRFFNVLTHHVKWLTSNSFSNSNVDYQKPIALDKQLDNLFMLFMEYGKIDFHKSKVSPHQYIERAYGAMRELENKGYVIDPPWLNARKAAAAIVLLGSIPVDFCLRTPVGSDLASYISLNATLWEYEYKRSKRDEEWRLKLKIADFVQDSMAHLANQYLESWKKTNNSVQPLPPRVYPGKS